jgi:hypothetical protein
MVGRLLGMNNFIDLKKFKENISPETAYVLGLLWADGSVQKKRITIEAIESDLKEVKEIFLSTGDWKVRQRTRNHWKPLMSFAIVNEDFCNLLLNHNFDKKSFVSHQQIVSAIPEHLRKFWLRGFWDGDGCFYFNEKNNLSQCVITSAFEQDWYFLQSFLKEINITSWIKKQQTKKGQYSQLGFCSKTQIINFISYLYPNNDNEKIGFSRKFEKALFMKKILEKKLNDKNKKKNT